MSDPNDNTTMSPAEQTTAVASEPTLTVTTSDGVPHAIDPVPEAPATVSHDGETTKYEAPPVAGKIELPAGPENGIPAPDVVAMGTAPVRRGAELGDVVLFHEQCGLSVIPRMAFVIYVWSSGCCNLRVFTDYGDAYTVTSANLGTAGEANRWIHKPGA